MEEDMRIDVHHHFSIGDMSAINHRLDAIVQKIDALATKEDAMSLEMDALQLAVTRNTTLDGSIIDLLAGIAAQLMATAGDKAAALALAADLNAKSDALAAAITANTPAAPPA
jgi:hypothetical protein